jgi:hypothetical protein
MTQALYAHMNNKTINKKKEVSHVQKFNKQSGWQRKNGAAASLGGSGLK